MNDAAVQDIQITFEGLSKAWKQGNGGAFAEWCTEDVDFINLLGMHVKGRRAVAELHDKIFHGPYKDSTVAFTIESLRKISPDAILAVAPGRVDVPAGPVQGIVLSIASVLLVPDGNLWKIANFHNTRCEATQSNHLGIMRSAVEEN